MRNSIASIPIITRNYRWTKAFFNYLIFIFQAIRSFVVCLLKMGCVTCWTRVEKDVSQEEYLLERGVLHEGLDCISHSGIECEPYFVVQYIAPALRRCEF